MADTVKGEVGYTTEWHGVEIKDASVNLSGIDTTLRTFLGVAGNVHFYLFAAPLVVTSGRDGQHVASSKHAEGKAVDVRIHDLTPGDQPAMLAYLRVLCERMSLAMFDESFAPGMGHVHIEIAG